MSGNFGKELKKYFSSIKRKLDRHNYDFILEEISPHLFIYRGGSTSEPVIFFCKDNIIKPLGKFFSNQCMEVFINNLEVVENG